MLEEDKNWNIDYKEIWFVCLFVCVCVYVCYMTTQENWIQFSRGSLNVWGVGEVLGQKPAPEASCFLQFVPWRKLRMKNFPNKSSWINFWRRNSWLFLLSTPSLPCKTPICVLDDWQNWLQPYIFSRGSVAMCYFLSIFYLPFFKVGNTDVHGNYHL